MAYDLTGYNVIQGTPATETLTGTALNDAVYGNGGNDKLRGGAGADVLFGGQDGGVTFEFSKDATWPSNFSRTVADPLGQPTPSDTFSLNGYGRTYDVYVGSGSNNTLLMTSGKNALILDDGVSPGVDSVRLHNIQTIVGGSGGQLIDLSSTSVTYGNVTVKGGTGNDVILSNIGNDTLTGGNGNDYLWGGAGNDSLSGGSGNDKLLGGSGNDYLDGGSGKDTMTGGTGDDTYIVDSSGDVIVELAGEGTDTVQSKVTFTLAANVENLTLTGTSSINGTGNALDNIIIGTKGNNVLSGGGGNDTISGGDGNDRLDGGTGNDHLTGGKGNDIYTVDSAGDQVVELAGEGTDTVQSSVTWTLAANIENLTLTGSLAINGTGNTLNNVITGNSADNILDGGAGNDRMTGGAGNDTYHVDAAGDVIVEAAGGGIDTVVSSISYTLGSTLENLTLAGAAISGTGNALDNVITGNASNNILSGGAGNDMLDGGAGADTMSGGTGNDTYYVDNAGDTVIENAGEGTDTVYSSVSITLPANIEHLVLTGTSAINITANGADNLLYGNEGNNVIDAGGGHDKVHGGGGDDTIIAGDGNDFVYGDEGNDTLYGGAGNDQLNGGARNDVLDGGTGNDSLWGGGGNDTIQGGDGIDSIFGDGGNDVIDGGADNDFISGGAQNDQLTGGGGDDTFVWTRPDIMHANGTWAGFDSITDFGAGDRLDFSLAFKGLPVSPIENMIRVTDTASGSVVSASFDGGTNFFDVVLLADQHLDLDDLVSFGQITV